MNEAKNPKKKNAVFVIDCSEYAIFTVSSSLYILNVVSNCYVSYSMYVAGHLEWFWTSITLLALFSLFTQIFSHIFFTYNNIADKACSPYLQHINAKSGDDENPENVSKKEFIEIHHHAVCPHSNHPDRLWTDKNLVELTQSKVDACQRFCSQAVSVVLHLLHIGPVIRYVYLLKFRAREMKKEGSEEDIEEKKIKDIERYFCKLCLLERAAGYSLRNITLLRLFEALEAAPQVLLQLYLVFYTSCFSVQLLGPAIIGTVQVSFCLALSVKYQRMPDRATKDQTVSGLCLITLYKIFLVSYRMLCLAVFGSLYRGYLVLLLSTHSLIMLVWILYLDSSFSSRNHEEIAFNFTVAMLKSFTFVNVSKGQSRNRVVLYHIFITVENVVIAFVWYYRTLDDLSYGLIAMASMGALYLLGVFIKTVYYACCHPTKSNPQGPGGVPKEISVMYKNKGQMITNPMKDSTHLLKHDDNTGNDVIHFPSSNSNTGSTWMLGFIEQNSDSLGAGRRLITPASYMHRGRYNYDTYQSVPGDSCSGYDSEVASIMSSKTPIYENLVPGNNSARIPLQHPISSLQHPISSLQHPISSLQHPISSLQHPISSLQHPISSLQHPISSLQHPISNISSIQHPISGIRHPLSNIQHPISSLHHPISNLKHPISNLQHPISSLPVQHPPLGNPILANPMVWQPQQLGPPSGRNSADAHYNNNDSLSSSGVYSEEERKLNLKARLESDYDNLEEPSDSRPAPETSLSPDSDNGDIYENLPTVIRQGQQVHSDGLTMQSIAIQGPQARFDGSMDSTPVSGNAQSWDLLQGSLNFAYGPPTSAVKENGGDDYTSLREVQPVKPPVPAVPARTTSSTVKHSSSQQSITDGAMRYQTDV